MAVTADVPKRFSSLIIELPVQQAGSGDPSPDNIRPIAQWTDVELYVADTDTATEPTLTTTLPTPIFGGMVDVARGEVASLYNEKKSSSGWEMVEAGQFRCQVGAFNNGDETSTNVADLYSSHYKTVSNKDAYDATDDLTCGTPTIEGVTYLYVNDLDYSTLEDFTAYIGDVQFVYKSHIPMSDVIEPTIVYLSEGTSYVWAEGAFYVETVTGTPPLSLPNSVGEPLEAWSVALSPYQDLHGYDSPWPAGGGKNKFNPAEATDDYWIKTDTGEPAPQAGYWITGYIPVKSGDIVRTPSKGSSQCAWVNSDKTTYTYVAYDGAANGITAPSDGYVIISCGKNLLPFGSDFIVTINNSDLTWTPYANICPIYGTDKLNIFVEESYDPTATPKEVITLPQTIYSGHVSDDGAVSNSGEVDMGTLRWAYEQSNQRFYTSSLIGIIKGNSTVKSDVYKNGSTLTTNGTAQVTASGYVYVRDEPYNTVSDFATAVAGHQLVYELATPTTITITTPDIPTPTGNATTWATAEDGVVDSMTVQYTRIAEQET